ARGDDSGRGKIHERLTVAHATLEIPVRRADCVFALLYQTATESNARTTPGRQRNCASTNQRLPITSGLSARLRLGAGRGKIKFNAIGDASAPRANNFRGVTQIFEARVNA